MVPTELATGSRHGPTATRPQARDRISQKLTLRHRMIHRPREIYFAWLISVPIHLGPDWPLG
jgi:hypothetical protein